MSASSARLVLGRASVAPASSLLSSVQSRTIYANRRPRTGAIKARKQAKEMAKEYIQEMTPQCLTKQNPFTGTFKDKISKIDVPNMLNRSKALSTFDLRNSQSKFSDVRFLSEAQWAKSDKRGKLIDSMLQSDLIGDLFKARTEKQTAEGAEFDQILSQNLKLNVYALFRRRPDQKLEDADSFFDTALFGNFIEVSQTQQLAPEDVYLRGAASDKLYTLMLVCPDHPSRVNPDGHMVHWLVVNIPGSEVAKGDVVRSYLPPMPTECAGAFRYAFLVYEQNQRIEDAQTALAQLPKETQDYSYKVDRKPSVEKQKQRKAETIRRAYLNQMPYEREYWESLEKEQQKREHEFVSKMAETVPCSDYRPPAPEKPADEATLADWQSRQSFDLEAFVTSESSRLASPLPVGLCYFHTDYDFVVSQKYQDLGIQEPFYVPIDYSAKQAKQTKLSMRKESYQLRNQWQ